MTMLKYNGTLDPSDHRVLYRKMRARIEEGQAEGERISELVASMLIDDKLVPPKLMNFSVGPSQELLFNVARYPDMKYRIHRNALRQLANGRDKVKIPMDFINEQLSRSTPWRSQAVADLFNVMYENTDFTTKQSPAPKFLHRFVGNELRGFLSQRFNISVASRELLCSFLEACGACGAAPFDGTATDVKFVMKCVLPYIFEPAPGTYVALGVEWSNSDFGMGRMQVAMTAWLPGTNSFTVLDGVMWKRHIGSVIEETNDVITPELIKKDTAAQQQAILDNVRQSLQPEKIDALLGAIGKAAEEKIPWEVLKKHIARIITAEKLKNLEAAMDDDEVIDLPRVPRQDGEIMPTKLWAVQALSWLSAHEDRVDQKLKLQRESSTFLPGNTGGGSD